VEIDKEEKKEEGEKEKTAEKRGERMGVRKEKEEMKVGGKGLRKSRTGIHE